MNPPCTFLSYVTFRSIHMTHMGISLEANVMKSHVLCVITCGTSQTRLISNLLTPRRKSQEQTPDKNRWIL
jgi:hypothetical protein